MQNRGQPFSFDLYIAFVIFVFMLAAASFFWVSKSVELSEKTETSLLQATAFKAVDLLLRTEGNPISWHKVNQAQVIWPGLLNKTGTISQEKLDVFVAMAQEDANYEVVKEMFGITYDFNFKLTDEDGQEITKTGKEITLIKTLQIKISEPVIYNGKNTYVDFVLFREK